MNTVVFSVGIPITGTRVITLQTRFMGTTWGPPGAVRTQVGPILPRWTLLSGHITLRLPQSPRSKSAEFGGIWFNHSTTVASDLRHRDVHVTSVSQQWQHNERDGVSNNRRLDYLLKRLFMHKSKKTRNLRVTSLCERNPPVISGFRSQRANNAENVSIWWRHHVMYLGLYRC